MKHMNRWHYLFIISAFLVSLFGVTFTVVQARSTQTHIDTTIFLTARVQNRWSYDGNLHCESVTLETEGQIYQGLIRPGNWQGADGSESCFIVFNNVATPLSSAPAKITVTHYSQVGSAAVGADKKQVEEKEYIQELAAVDGHVVLDDMILGDGAASGGTQNNALTPTTVHLTARASNKWWVGGNLVCDSAALSALGKTYNGSITSGSGFELPGRDFCTIVFNNVLLPPGATPASITVSYHTLFADQITEQLTSGRQQTQQKNDTINKSLGDSSVTLAEMTLEDASTAPVIEVDPTPFPTLPLPPVITLP
jgi:hypothetical protein